MNSSTVKKYKDNNEHHPRTCRTIKKSKNEHHSRTCRTIKRITNKYFFKKYKSIKIININVQNYTFIDKQQ